MTTVEMLAREGHGAVQVDESLDRQPPIVFLAGPIKYWWQPGNWDSLLHQDYVRWRDAVRVSLVKAGCAVYSPHRAIQGRWNEKLQAINDAAIRNANFVVVLTPVGVPAEGTNHEVALAHRCCITVIHLPPGDDEELDLLIDTIRRHVPEKL